MLDFFGQSSSQLVTVASRASVDIFLERLLDGSLAQFGRHLHLSADRRALSTSLSGTVTWKNSWLHFTYSLSSPVECPAFKPNPSAYVPLPCFAVCSLYKFPNASELAHARARAQQRPCVWKVGARVWQVHAFPFGKDEERHSSLARCILNYRLIIYCSVVYFHRISSPSVSREKMKKEQK